MTPAALEKVAVRLAGDGWHYTPRQLYYAVCAELDLFREGVLPQSGFVRQEQVPLDAFLGNRFGKLYEGANAVATARQFAVA